eukprot:TRINITY_DN4765_c0_g1_i4.p1 TRINITY_DN4765_c0_g1~~TRINITY_DN4765_c0_g1_i4.p1  ORF type:complete len:236 (+),score=29.90 TRINITY_DN4765_c0_g1_i4:179-886(+)
MNFVTSIPHLIPLDSRANKEAVPSTKEATSNSVVNLDFLDKLPKPKGRCKRKIIKSKKSWSKEEDEAIKQLVKKYGVKKWSLIAEMLDALYGLKGRNGKQCRERWHNYLNPTIKKLPLSDEEEKLIFAKHREHGNKWAEIARCLSGRNDNVIKNYYYATLRRQLRKILKKVKGGSNMPEEITLQHISKIMAEHNLSYDEIDNENVRAELKLLNKNSEPYIVDKRTHCLPSYRHSL